MTMKKLSTALLRSVYLFAVSTSVSPLLTACSGSGIEKVRTGASCSSNADCGAADVCFDGKCTPDLDCTQAENKKTLLCNPTLGCQTDSDCPDETYYCDGKGQVCLVGSRPPCSGDEDCVDGERCLSFIDTTKNVCVGCLLSSDCAAGELCQADHGCAAPADDVACTSDFDCTSAGARVCDPIAGACVECLRSSDCGDATMVCADRACASVLAGADCETTGCADRTKPVCDATCVACDTSAETQELCGTGTVCDAGAGSPTKGQCIPEQAAIAGACSTNADCALELQADPNARATLFCDRQNRVCRPCESSMQCGKGWSCESQVSAAAVTQNTCIENTTTACRSAADCDGAVDACVNGACQASCQRGTQCRGGQFCSQTGHVCVASAGSCITNNDCLDAADAYTGQICAGAHCIPCTSDSECAQNTTDAAAGFTVCDQTLRLCRVADAATGLALGAACASNGDCASGLCLDPGIGMSLCTAVCARTFTSDPAEPTDCPSAPEAADGTTNYVKIDYTGGPATYVSNVGGLTATSGFTCHRGSPGTVLDGLSLCLHADLFGNATATAGLSAGSLVQPGGFNQGAADANGVACQAAHNYSSAIAGSFLCAQTCGSTADCASGATDFDTFSCSEVLGTTAAGVPTGERICAKPAKGASAAGEFCESAATCAERFCGGRCMTDAGSTGSSCGGHDDCESDEQCQGGVCYKTSALTERGCQNSNQCASGETCRGTCLAHCNSGADCGGGTVCGLWPGSPAGGVGVEGSAWSLVCRPAAGHGEGGFGDECVVDGDCASEVCVGGVCSDVCSRDGVCEGGRCSVVERAVAGSTEHRLTPVCVGI